MMAVAVLLFGIVEEGVLYGALPEYYTGYTLFIMPYFLLLTWMLYAAVKHMQKKGYEPQLIIQRWMQLTMAQMLLSLVVLLIYVELIDVQRVAFLLTFCIFYFWYIALKMYTLRKLNFSKPTAPTSSEQ